MVLRLPPINQNICILIPNPPSKAVYRLFADTLPIFLNLGKTEIGDGLGMVCISQGI